MWLHLCCGFCSLCVRAAESTWSYWVKTLKKGNVTEGEMRGLGVKSCLPPCLHRGSMCAPPWAVWYCSISLGLRRCMSYALHNNSCVLQRGVFCWLFLFTQTDFGFHLVTLWRTAWKWWHSQLVVPHVTEFAAMFSQCKCATLGVFLTHLVFPTCQWRRTGTSWLTLRINHKLKEPEVLILILKEARGEELRCPSTL